jgi:phage gp46-like protein
MARSRGLGDVYKRQVQRLDASGGYGDWMMAEAGNQRESLGGLRAEAALHTATLMQLFTDRRLPADRANPSGDSDPRGWWGDHIRLDGEPEAELGSLLWTLERSAMTDRLARDAKDIVADAMAVLERQGAVARTDVETSIDRKTAALLIVIRHYSHDGARIYDQRFGVLWAQAARGAEMNFGDRSLVLA